MAVLLTETSLVNDGVEILKWFGRKGGGRAGWKLVLPPNVKSWLLNEGLRSAPDVREK